MFPRYNFWIWEVAQQWRIYISRLYLCVYQTRPSWVLDVQCALVVETPLSLLQRHKLSSMVPNSAFLVHIDSCRPTRGQIEPPGKRWFFYLFPPSLFSREKIKLQKQSAKLANIDLLMLRIAHLKRRQVQFFCRAPCIYCMSGKPYCLIFQKNTVRVTDIGTTSRPNSSHQIFKCPISHRIRIWSQKDWF